MSLFTALIGPICLLAGIFLTLYVKDKAREIAKEEFAEGIKLALATFKDELIEKLDAIYSRVPELKLMLESRDVKAEQMQDRLDMYGEAIRDMENANNLLSIKVNNLEGNVERLKNERSKA